MGFNLFSNDKKSSNAIYDNGITNLKDFKAVNNADVGTRYYGGSNRREHPFVKGYFQAFFELPPLVAADGSSSPNDPNAIILTASSNLFNPHGDRSLITVDIIGQGNVGATYVVGQNIDRNFSIVFNEKYRSPIWKVFRKWTSLIIDPYTGLSKLQTYEGAEYKGRCIVVETMPVRLDAGASDEMFKRNIIRVFYYDGVFPRTDISSIFESNTASPDANVEINMQFSFDAQPLDDTNGKTLEKAIAYMRNANLYKEIIEYYTNLYKL